MNHGKAISWTPAMLATLKENYTQALQNRQDQFTFVEMEGEGFMARKVDEHPMLVSYAKYLIEYLEGEFGKPQPMRGEYREGKEGE